MPYRDRDRGRGGRHGSGGRGKPGRRTPPPDATGAEAEYLLRNKEGRRPLVFRLTDGNTIRGVIEYYDRHMIKVTRTDGPNVFVRKEWIRYIHPDED